MTDNSPHPACMAPDGDEPCGAFTRLVETGKEMADELKAAQARIAALEGELKRLVANYSYLTPAGPTICRYCNMNVDREGTGINQCDENCEIRTARRALGETE